MDDLDQRGGRDVGQIRQRRAFLVGQGRRRNREKGDEHDDGKEVALDRRPYRVGRDQLDDEARAARDVLGGLVDETRVGDGRLPQCRLLLGVEPAERENERADDEADQDGRDRGAPEEAQRPEHEAPDGLEVAELRDPGEQGGRDERDHHHLEEIQEQRAHGAQMLGDPQQLATLRRRGDEAEQQAPEEAQSHPQVASHDTRAIIPGTGYGRNGWHTRRRRPRSGPSSWAPRAGSVKGPPGPSRRRAMISPGAIWTARPGSTTWPRSVAAPRPWGGRPSTSTSTPPTRKSAARFWPSWPSRS